MRQGIQASFLAADDDGDDDDDRYQTTLAAELKLRTNERLRREEEYISVQEQTKTQTDEMRWPKAQRSR
jgi:hypothetical protein